MFFSLFSPLIRLGERSSTNGMCWPRFCSLFSWRMPCFGTGCDEFVVKNRKVQLICIIKQNPMHACRGRYQLS